MPIGRIGAHSFALEHREELMLAEFEKGIAFAFVELLESEDILIKCDRFFDVADFDGDVITAIDLHAHRLVGLILVAAICFASRTTSSPSPRHSMNRAGTPARTPGNDGL